MENKQYPQRKPTRIKGYDYSQPSSYYITICTYQRKLTLGTVVHGDEMNLPICILSEYGSIAERELWDLEQRFPLLAIEHYVIMPNHIHVLVTLREKERSGERKDISAIFGAFKSLTTRKCRKAGLSEQHLFQSSFYDEVIRSETHYQNCWRYIDENPIKWSLEEYYRER